MTSFNVQEFRARLGSAADQPLRANAPLAVALGGVACFCGFVLIGPLVSRSVADDAGVMSFLLSEAPRRVLAQAANFGHFARPRADARALRPQQRIAHRSVRAHVASTARPRKVLAQATPRVAPIASAARTNATLGRLSVSPLTDVTLRRGDAVMTASGIRIFQGARHYPFAMADFRSLASAGNVPHRGALVAIDKVVRPPTWTAAFTPTLPAGAIAPTLIDAQVGVRAVEILRRS